MFKFDARKLYWKYINQHLFLYLFIVLSVKSFFAKHFVFCVKDKQIKNSFFQFGRRIQSKWWWNNWDAIILRFYNLILFPRCFFSPSLSPSLSPSHSSSHSPSLSPCTLLTLNTFSRLRWNSTLPKFNTTAKSNKFPEIEQFLSKQFLSAEIQENFNFLKVLHKSSLEEEARYNLN